MIYGVTHKTQVFLNLQQLSVIECKKRKGSVTLARSCAIGDFQEQPR